MKLITCCMVKQARRTGCGQCRGERLVIINLAILTTYTRYSTPSPIDRPPRGACAETESSSEDCWPTIKGAKSTQRLIQSGRLTGLRLFLREAAVYTLTSRYKWLWEGHPELGNQTWRKRTEKNLRCRGRIPQCRR